jgi:hypothetical protein
MLKRLDTPLATALLSDMKAFKNYVFVCGHGSEQYCSACHDVFAVLQQYNTTQIKKIYCLKTLCTRSFLKQLACFFNALAVHNTILKQNCFFTVESLNYFVLLCFLN